MDNSFIFKRKIYDRMLQWKQERRGASALLIQGARRIGKSTIVETFAKQEYRSYILIDFGEAPKKVQALFEDISDLNHIFFQLQFLYQTELYERESVIVFDEVQRNPIARQAIKQLVKDGRYDYIETGSLISMRKSSTEILIPSEETRLNMYPMDYEEFRWTLGDTTTVPLLRKAFEQKMVLGDVVHRKMMRDFRLYMLVGGMPQAVAEYLRTNNLGAVDAVKREIIDLYKEDMVKFDESGRAGDLFDSIPAQLSKNSMRFQPSAIKNGERIDRILDSVQRMGESMTTNIAFHVNDPSAGLALTRDTKRFKLYTCDTGLFITLAFKDKEFTENVIYQKLLGDKLSVNLGYVYENIVAQTLCATGKKLYYHTMPTHDGKKFYEVDFLLADQHKVTPIEVKSSGYKTHTSLDAFCTKYSDRILQRYVIYTKEMQWQDSICYLPVYMTMFL